MVDTSRLFFPVLAIALLLSGCAGFELQGESEENAQGARLYALHCAACHGESGRGGVGVPLALPDFLNSVSNDYIERSIRTGRPGRAMPAFTDLGEGQVEDIVLHIRGWSWVSPPEYSKEPVMGDRQRGKNLYAKHCGYCHGQNGEGGKGVGVSFSRPRSAPIIAPALNNIGFLASASDMMIKETLMKGRSNTPMRSFLKKGLSEKDIDDVVSYIRSYELQATKQTREAKKEIVPILLQVSAFSFEETLERLETAIKRQDYRIIRELPLDDGLVSSGSENTKQWIIYFANFNLINEALSRDPRVGLFLPARLTLVEQEGDVVVMASNPLLYSQLFSNTALSDFGEMMQQVYLSIIGEATTL